MFEQIFAILVLLLAIVIHELSHGLVAFSLGDPTPKIAGRLTLNPLKHLDPLGTVLIPLFLYIATFGQGPIFGWAKPVPVNPLFFKDQKFGTLKVALAGPLSNLILGIFFSLLLRIPFFQSFSFPFSLISIYNFLLAFFNLLPFYPLDGYHIISATFKSEKLNLFLFQYGFFLLVLFLVFGIGFIFNLSHFIFRLISGI